MLMMQRAEEGATPAICLEEETQLLCLLGLDGCPAECAGVSTDDDADGVVNADDDCANTAAGAEVDTDGCSAEQLTDPRPDLVGSLDVNVSSENPAGMDIPGNGNNIPVMGLDFTAGSEDITLYNVNVCKTAYTQNSSIDKIYLKDDRGLTLSNQRALSSDGCATINLKGGYTIKAGSTETFMVYIDVVSGANKQFQFKVNSTSDVDSSAADVSGGFPIVGPEAPHFGIDYTAQKIKFQGQYANTYSTSGTTKTDIIVGDEGAEIGKFTLEATSENKKDVYVQSIRLENVKNVADFLDNITVSTTEELDVDLDVNGKYLTLLFPGDGYKINYGNTATFYINADVVGGEATDVLEFNLDSTSDIVAYEKDTYATLSVSSALAFMKPYQIKEGDNLITKASESPITSNIGNDSAETTAFIANVNFKSEVYVQKLNLTMNTGNLQVEKIKLYVGDRFYDEGTWNAAK